ncbi:hypothetical protein BLNAU_10791 [Blattamonas nauphoetae]|uniref:Uncharacterized protein n=1 Tax=Blattamonas nauphoetae TaxID=2049346 RepID=A0ABQ9XPE5_9EUKA|nr:hypothetical protein BLNAU_10791 [Blattamonas nauphoetae]
MFITGTLTHKSFLSHEEPEKAVYNQVDFVCTDLDESVRPEPIKMRAYSFDRAVFKRIPHLIESGEIVTACVSIYKRRDDFHDVRLYNFIPQSFKSTAVLGKEQEVQNTQFVTWEYAPADFHVSAMADGNVKDDEPQPAQNPDFQARQDLSTATASHHGDRMDVLS